MQRAEEAADYILKVRQNRLNLLSATAEVAFEKGSMQYMSEELEKIEKEYMTLFTGIVTEEKSSYTYYIYPAINKTDYALFSFSPNEGILKDETNQNSLVKLTIHQNHYYSDLNKVFSEKHFAKGFPIRLAEQCDVVAKSNNQTFLSEKVQILQYGNVYHLPFSKWTKVSLSKEGLLEFLKY
jgi:hypothetical protein